jgi:hypothetical protein
MKVGLFFTFAAVLGLECCAHSVPVVVPAPETPCEMILRTEGVSCATLAAGHDVGAPTPDTIKMYNAFVRGRNRVALLYPAAANIKMNALNFWQTAVHWNPGEAFPRMPDGAMAITLVGINIQFAFEQCIEHETTHALIWLLDPGKVRTQAAIDDPADADQKALGFDHIYQITCHLTVDDPIVDDGPSLSVSGRAGCVQAYDGPVNPGLNQ